MRPTATPQPHTTIVELSPAPPFAWRQTLAALRGFEAVPDRGAPHAGDPPGWELAVRLPGDERGGTLALARLEEPPGSEAAAPSLRLHLASPNPLDADAIAAAQRQVNDFLALDLDLTPLLAEAADDPAFEPVARALHGFHPLRFRSAFQAACWTVVRQRTPPSFAQETMRRLAELLGDELPAALAPGQPLRLFPTPETLATGARPALQAATNNLRKVERLEALGEAFSRVDEAALRHADYDEVRRWLESLSGLGPWSAEQVLWRGLGRHERAPWRDTGAVAAASAVYTPGLSLVTGAARRLGLHYGELQGVWMAYLKAYPRVLARPAP